MTRETKIGLLVGLAFIIVIGILLSDHMTATTEVPQASLTNTANSVRDGVAAPATEQPSSTVILPVTPLTPHQTVPTHNEAPTIRASDSDVRVGPGHGEIPPPFTTRKAPGSVQSIGSDTQPPQPIAKRVDEAAMPRASQSPITNPDRSVSGDLDALARTHGEQLIPVGNTGNAASHTENTGATKHVAEAGDSLSKMAARFLGGNTKANRDLLIKANPSLQQDPNKVVVGRTYVIPAGSPASAAPAAATSRTPSAPLTVVETPERSTAIWYTVKENDSLWTIAAEKLGNGSAYTAIKELNKDILKGGDTVTPNMRLRLPSDRPVGSASAQ